MLNNGAHMLNNCVHMLEKSYHVNTPRHRNIVPQTG